MDISKLKDSILKLAVQGKLDTQNSNDEPARELLKKISAEKKRLIVEGKIRKQKALPPIKDDEEPFDIPANWKWVKLGEIAIHHLGGGTPSKYKGEFWNGDIPWASVKDMNCKYLESTIDFITEEGLKNSSSNLIGINSIVVCTRMGLGKVCITKRDVAINQDLRALCFDKNVDIEFMYAAISSISIKGTGTTVKGIKIEQLLNFLIPLPPLEEQKRIVDKVDELFALCDKLEAEKKNMLEYVDLFKQEVLNQAVRGKLTEQNEDDEPVSELIMKIVAEKNRLIEEGTIRKQKTLLPIENDEKPFEIPDSWEWVRLGKVVDVINGRAYKKSELLQDGKTPVLRVGNLFTNKNWYYSNLELEGNKYCDAGDLLYAWSASFGPEIWQGPRAIFHYHIWKLDIYGGIDKFYLYYLLLNETIKLKASGHGVVMIHITKTYMEKKLICLPPLEEQKRIVEKVDELFALADSLIEELDDEEHFKQRLNKVIESQAQVS